MVASTRQTAASSTRHRERIAQAEPVVMEQSRIESFIETTANIASGFVISWAVWIWVVPILWPHLKTGAGLGFAITTLFTVTSFLRSYGWRRFFANRFHLWVHRLIKTVWNW